MQLKKNIYYNFFLIYLDLWLMLHIFAELFPYIRKLALIIEE